MRFLNLTTNNTLKKRKSIRLKNYNYSKPGYYFITLCTQNRKNIFGEIINGRMILNKFGNIIKEEWDRTAKIRPEITLDEFIIMPNHIHGIIKINHQSPIRSTGVLQYAPTAPTAATAFTSPSQTIGSLIRGFKGATTKNINIFRNTPKNKLWQRNYYESIIRTEQALYNIRNYIRNNPKNWLKDKNNSNK